MIFGIYRVHINLAYVLKLTIYENFNFWSKDSSCLYLDIVFFALSNCKLVFTAKAKIPFVYYLFAIDIYVTIVR